MSYWIGKLGGDVPASRKEDSGGGYRRGETDTTNAPPPRQRRSSHQPMRTTDSEYTVAPTSASTKRHPRRSIAHAPVMMQPQTRFDGDDADDPRRPHRQQRHFQTAPRGSPSSHSSNSEDSSSDATPYDVQTSAPSSRFLRVLPEAEEDAVNNRRYSYCPNGTRQPYVEEQAQKDEDSMTQRRYTHDAYSDNRHYRPERASYTDQTAYYRRQSTSAKQIHYRPHSRGNGEVAADYRGRVSDSGLYDAQEEHRFHDSSVDAMPLSPPTHASRKSSEDGRRSSSPQHFLPLSLARAHHGKGKNINDENAWQQQQHNEDVIGTAGLSRTSSTLHEEERSLPPSRTNSRLSNSIRSHTAAGDVQPNIDHSSLQSGGGCEIGRKLSYNTDMIGGRRRLPQTPQQQQPQERQRTPPSSKSSRSTPEPYQLTNADAPPALQQREATLRQSPDPLLHSPELIQRRSRAGSRRLPTAPSPQPPQQQPPPELQFEAARTMPKSPSITYSVSETETDSEQPVTHTVGKTASPQKDHHQRPSSTIDTPAALRLAQARQSIGSGGAGGSPVGSVGGTLNPLAMNSQWSKRRLSSEQIMARHTGGGVSPESKLSTTSMTASRSSNDVEVNTAAVYGLDPKLYGTGGGEGERKDSMAAPTTVGVEPAADTKAPVAKPAWPDLSSDVKQSGGLGTLHYSMQYFPVRKRLRVNIMKCEGVAGQLRPEMELQAFAKIYLNPGKLQKQTSRIVKRTRDIIFGDEYFFDNVSATDLQSKSVCIRICHHIGKQFHKDVVIGYIDVPLKEINDLDSRREVLLVENLKPKINTKKLGKLQISTCLDNKCLTINVIKADDLPKYGISGPPDPVVKIMVEQNGKLQSKQTRTLKNCCNAAWREAVMFLISSDKEDLHETKVTVGVYDAARTSTGHDLIGVVYLGCLAKEKVEIEQWKSTTHSTGKEHKVTHSLKLPQDMLDEAKKDHSDDE